MIEPSHVVGLPKGQCFALLQGGQLWKVRMPLPAPDPDEVMPADLQQLAGYMHGATARPRSGGSSPVPRSCRTRPCPTICSMRRPSAELRPPARARTARRRGTAMRDAASTAQREQNQPPGLDRRHHHLAVPAARGADRLAAVLDPGGVHRHAPVLEGPRLAALPADVAVPSWGTCPSISRAAWSCRSRGERRTSWWTPATNGFRAIRARWSA